MTLRDALTDAVLAGSRWQRRKVGYPELERWRAAKIDEYPQAFVGTSSITVPQANLKLVAYDEWPVTSGELARAYLHRVYADAPRRPLPSPRARGFSWTAPIVANPVRHRALAYVDVESAYWQLISIFRPDDLVLGDEVVPGTLEWLNKETVAEDRRLRHCVHGSIFSNRLVFYRYGTPVVVPKVNRWSNPSLALHCFQTLHAVCRRVAAGTSLHAWMTDAAIVDADDAEPVAALMAGEWLLRSRLKAQGAGTVVSATTYAVGDKMSLDVVHGTTDLARAEPRKFSNLKRVPWRQLQSTRKGVAA